MIKKNLALLAIVLMTMLFSVNTYASRLCLNGDTPKFRTSTVTYHVEPILWDHLETRKIIQKAFTDWSAATGWKLKFVVVRGSDTEKGDYDDEIFQVRTDWLRHEPNIAYRDGGRNYLAQSVVLSTREEGQQCYWWDNDIVFNKGYFKDGVYTYAGKSTYSTMLHEIGHALGMPHNSELSTVNPFRQNIVARGLYGFDISFVRNLYSTHAVNLRRNFRADDVMPQSRIRNSKTEIFLTQFNNVGNFYEGPAGPITSKIVLPYNVTNEGSYGESVKIEFLGARNQWSLINTTPIVLHTEYVFVPAGTTAYDWVRFDVARSTLGEVSKFAFRVVAYDNRPWDDFILLP